MESISIDELQQVYPLLNQLKVGFLLVGSDRLVRYATLHARDLVGRRVLKKDIEALLGNEVFDLFCEPILSRRVANSLWQDVQITTTAGSEIDVSVSSLAVRFPEEQVGILLALQDISGEVGLHRNYTKLLDEQKQINRRLRREIAAKLREHEDDISQFSEILQLAPTIFGTFISEANAAVDSVEALTAEQPSESDVTAALRAMHTLKGNARSLGLYFIGGRAHAVEDLLQRLKSRRDWTAEENLEALFELLEALRRAIDRARVLRQRIAQSTVQASQGLDLEQYQALSQVQLNLQRALTAVQDADAVRALLNEANTLLDACGRIPLQPLFDYAGTAVRNVAQNANCELPRVETRSEVRVTPAVYRALAVAVPHIARNAVTHGLETASERAEQGKSPVGTVSFVAEGDVDSVRVVVKDDGRGLAVEKLRQAAEQRGFNIPNDTANLADLIFLPGVSTADDLTLDSGRGLGAGAALEAIKEVGGVIQVKSQPGAGAEFQITISN